MGTFEDGVVFDTSDNHGPLEFKLGAGVVIRGFEDAVIGMKPGEEKEIRLTPREAYGDHNPQLIKKVPRETLKKIEDLEEGMTMTVEGPGGLEIPVRVSQIGPEQVTIDLNHPLAGKTLQFKIKLLEIV